MTDLPLPEPAPDPRPERDLDDADILTDEVTVAILENSLNDREGFRLLLEHATTRIRVVGATDSPEMCVELVRTHLPDVALVDLRINGDDTAGIRVVEQIKRISPQTRVLVYTGFATLLNFKQSIAAGADGFLNKEGQAMRLDEAVTRVARGESLYPRELLSQLMTFVEDHRLPRDDVEALMRGPSYAPPTEREIEVLRLVLAGKSVDDIASGLSIQRDTVKQHLKNLHKKWNVRTRADLLIVARTHFRRQIERDRPDE
jgi:DNA-binding NarL/FixJ family response regulator